MVTRLTHAVCAVALFATLGMGAPAFADVLVLTDGKMIEGDITDRGEAYEVKTRFGALHVQKSEIKKIVKSPAQAVAEAEMQRKLAGTALESAANLADAKERRTKLAGVLDAMEKAQKACQETREVFTGPGYDSLDAAVAGLTDDIRRYREKLAGPAPAVPVAPATPQNPVASPLTPPTPPAVPGPAQVPPKPAVPAMPAPPSDDAQKQAATLIRDIFKDDYAKRASSDLVALARKLLKQGHDTKDDLTARFVLFREARDLALQGGDAGTAIQAVDAMAKFYAVDPLAEKLSTLEKAEGSSKTPDAARALADLYLRLMDEAVSANHYDVALRAGARAEIAARLTRDTTLMSRIRDQLKGIQDIQKEAAMLASHQKALESNPDDPAANVAMGKFYCLTKGDWEKGLPMLVKGSDPVLKALAGKELNKPAETADIMTLADAWWDAGEKQGGAAKPKYLERAIYWYGAAAPKASGLTQSKISARMAAFDKMFPQKATPGGQLVFQGFGTTTRGGLGQPVVHVTSLADGGEGSLRSALSQGNRTIVFDLAGEIPLTYGLAVEHPFITIDGSSAPPPGVTLKGHGLTIRGENAHDVIVRGLRIRGGGIGIGNKAHSIVVDHVSVHKSGGGGIGIGSNVRDVTVCWSIFSEAGIYSCPAEIGDCSRLSFHHNLIAKAPRNVVQVHGDYVPAGTASPRAPQTDITVDFRNNVVWGWPTSGWGLHLAHHVRLNIVGNLFASGGGDKDHAVAGHRDAKVFSTMNTLVDGGGKDPNSGDLRAPFPAAPVKATDAFTAARDILTGAGVRPLDAADQELIRATGLLR